MSQLDEILTGIASALSGVEIKSTSSSDTVNNLFMVNTGRMIADDKNPIDWVIQRVALEGLRLPQACR
jgi:hypothetical protein